MKHSEILLALSCFIIAACGTESNDVYTLHGGDLTLTVTPFGARIMTLTAPDVDGTLENIVVGHKTVAEYRTPVGERFLGATVGPVANRIGNASFSVNGEEFNTPANDNGVNTLHGGFSGIDMVDWDVKEVTDSSITLAYLHKDMQEGFPGNKEISLTYTLTAQNELRVDITAVTDKPTPINITHHPFFCLRGEGNGTVEEYILTIDASHFIPIDSLSIPTGEILPVEGTPFDFRYPHLIGERIGEDSPQLLNGRGYDHNWCLDHPEGELARACRLVDPVSGRIVEVFTDQCGLQVYSGNFFDGSECGSNGRRLGWRSSIALEAQRWPDAVNNPSFGSCILQPGETYSSTTVYRFSTASDK